MRQTELVSHVIDKNCDMREPGDGRLRATRKNREIFLPLKYSFFWDVTQMWLL
jgi:hypothetical protein